MNLFAHYKQRENHCTNILMNLLAMNEGTLLRPFLENIILDAWNLSYGDVRFLLFSEHPPAEMKPFEYIIGIAPLPRKETGETPLYWTVIPLLSYLFVTKTIVSAISNSR